MIFSSSPLVVFLSISFFFPQYQVIYLAFLQKAGTSSSSETNLRAKICLQCNPFKSKSYLTYVIIHQSYVKLYILFCPSNLLPAHGSSHILCSWQVFGVLECPEYSTQPSGASVYRSVEGDREAQDSLPVSENNPGPTLGHNPGYRDPATGPAQVTLHLGSK